MAKTKRKYETKAEIKRRKIKTAISFVFPVLAALMIIVPSILDATGIVPYENMMAFLGLTDNNLTDAEVSVHCIDVGQGDSILIKSGDKTVLIDGGEKNCSEIVSLYLRQQGITKIDYLIATHPHSDHIGGLSDIVSEYEIENIIMPKIAQESVPTSALYTELLEEIKKKGLKITAAVPGNSYDLGISSLKILGPCKEYSDLNDYSVVTELTHGKNTFLFMGDAEKASENDIIKMGYAEDIDVLKVGHHGSSSSSGKKFLDIVKPEYAVISCGAGNKYNHPNESTMERLAGYTSEIYRTDLQGNVLFESDGDKIKCDFSK